MVTIRSNLGLCRKVGQRSHADKEKLVKREVTGKAHDVIGADKVVDSISGTTGFALDSSMKPLVLTTNKSWLISPKAKKMCDSSKSYQLPAAKK